MPDMRDAMRGAGLQGTRPQGNRPGGAREARLATAGGTIHFHPDIQSI